jgi:hypothetical protein
VPYPEGSRAVKVGVLLARQPTDLGEWLAAAAAFDAAGADALWVDVVPEPQLDPLALTAALAVVTSRALLVATLPTGAIRPAGGPRPDLPTTLATIGRLSRGRLNILVTDGGTGPIAVSADTRYQPGMFRRVPGRPGVFEQTGADGVAHHWVTTAVPDSRAGWDATRAAAAEGGTRGLLVPADPRLLDLLRNPDEPGDRRDLQLAQG